MAHKLKDIYSGLVTIDGNNPDGTFKNRTSDILKDGTPFERRWTSDLWGFVTKLLQMGGVVANNTEENLNNFQYFQALTNYNQAIVDSYRYEYDFLITGLNWTTIYARLIPYFNPTPGAVAADQWGAKIYVGGLMTNAARLGVMLTCTGFSFSSLYGDVPLIVIPNIGQIQQSVNAYAVPNTNTIQIVHANLVTNAYAFSGHVRLAAKPSFVP